MPLQILDAEIFGVTDHETIPVVKSMEHPVLVGMARRKEILSAYNKAVFVRFSGVN